LYYARNVTRDEQFAALMADLAREVTRRRSSEACCGDLTLEQFETLQVVSRTETPTIGALSAALEVDISTMSRNASVLERNGYLARVRSVDDARVVHVSLTAKGRKALHTFQCSERDVLAAAYAKIPPAERAGIVRALESLRACLVESEASDPGAPCCTPAAPLVPLSSKRRPA